MVLDRGDCGAARVRVCGRMGAGWLGIGMRAGGPLTNRGSPQQCASALYTGVGDAVCVRGLRGTRRRRKCIMKAGTRGGEGGGGGTSSTHTRARCSQGNPSGRRPSACRTSSGQLPSRGPSDGAVSASDVTQSRSAALPGLRRVLGGHAEHRLAVLHAVLDTDVHEILLVHRSRGARLSKRRWLVVRPADAEEHAEEKDEGNAGLEDHAVAHHAERGGLVAAGERADASCQNNHNSAKACDGGDGPVRTAEAQGWVEHDQVVERAFSGQRALRPPGVRWRRALLGRGGALRQTAAASRAARMPQAALGATTSGHTTTFVLWHAPLPRRWLVRCPGAFAERRRCPSAATRIDLRQSR